MSGAARNGFRGSGGVGGSVVDTTLCAMTLQVKLERREFFRGRGIFCNPNVVSCSPRFAPLASSAGNQDQTVSALTTLVVLSH